MKNFLAHFFLPRESNNYRAKLLHHSVLVLAILFLIFSSLLISVAKNNYPSVLGASTDISNEQLLLLTNTERQKNNLAPLTLDSRLIQAAQNKGSDMLAKDYWAHNSPDGTTPWYFIKASGYNYVYAGENLARGFYSSGDLMSAWMASPDHRANILSPNFQNVGFAVLNGRLSGEDTILVVEEFGGQALQVEQPNTPQHPAEKQAVQVQQQEPIVQHAVSGVKNLSLAQVPTIPTVQVKNISSYVSILVIGMFIAALIMDIVIIRRKKVIRVIGHSMDHVFFLLFIAILIFLFNQGLTL